MTAPVQTLTFDQVAEALQCSRSTVKRLVNRRHLRVVRVGKLARVRVTELERYLESGGRRQRA